MSNRLCVTLSIFVCLSAGYVFAAQMEATLSTSAGASITANQLDQYIDSFIDPTANRLLVFTQCYGGDAASQFAGSSNTAVGSATSPGQEAIYGGYDNDAAGALTPGAGRTGQDVHDAGVAGKDDDETPSTGGGLPLSSFDLSPVDPENGPVKSRHIVVYAGQPDDSPGRDEDQALDIWANNFTEPCTTVSLVGGDGGGIWDQPGSAAGLRNAIASAGQAIRDSDDPSAEQFILFVTDHGDLHKKEPVTTPVPQLSSVTINSVSSFQTPELTGTSNIIDPGFSIRLELPTGMTHPVGPPFSYVPFYQPGDWNMILDNGVLPPLPLDVFEELYVDLDGSGIIGDVADEGVELAFKMDPNFWVDSFFDVTYDVDIFNNTPDEVLLVDFSQDTGPVAKLSMQGDVNGDGFVDGGDLNTIMGNWGLIGALRGDGDLTGEGDVGGADYNEVLSNWGAGIPAPPEATPEPATLGLLALGILALAKRRR